MGRRRFYFFNTTIGFFLILSLIVCRGRCGENNNEITQPVRSVTVTRYIITEYKEPAVREYTSEKESSPAENSLQPEDRHALYINSEDFYRLERVGSEIVLIQKDGQMCVLDTYAKRAIFKIREKEHPLRIIRDSKNSEELNKLLFTNVYDFVQKHCVRKWGEVIEGADHEVYMAEVDGVMIELACKKGLKEPERVKVIKAFDDIRTYVYEDVDEGIAVEEKMFDVPEGFEIVEPKGALKIEGIEQELLSGKKAWAMGCAAPLSERNHDRYDILAGVDITTSTISEEKKLLKKWWGDESREDVLESIKWLTTEGGHRSSFKRIADEISELDEKQFKNYLNRYLFNYEKTYEILVVRKYCKELGETGILAWDYVRLVNMCRWGYRVGYLTEEEAWDIILPVAEELRRNFDSWEEMGRNYIIGRYFWSVGEMTEDKELFDEAMMRLTEMPTSPWNMYPWDMKFEEE